VARRIGHRRGSRVAVTVDPRTPPEAGDPLLLPPPPAAPAARQAGRSRQRVGRRAVAFVAVAAIVVAAVVTLNLPERVDPDIAFADVAWTELIPPNATVMESRGGMPPEGRNLVGGRVWVGTNASDDEIKDFYKSLLDDRPGWAPDRSLVDMKWTGESDACVWHNDRLTMRLGLRDMGGWRELNAPDRAWPTVYTIEVVDQTTPEIASTACVSDR
jgi:hypothetical protein